MIEVIKFGFFNMGSTTASLKYTRTIPEARLLFTIFLTLGPMVSKDSLKRRVGIMSVGQEEGLSEVTILVRD